MTWELPPFGEYTRTEYWGAMDWAVWRRKIGVVVLNPAWDDLLRSHGLWE